MKKILLLMLAASLLMVTAVGCAGSGVNPGTGAGAGAPNEPDEELPEGTVEDLPGEVIDGDGSDIIFDGDIILPGGFEETHVGFASGSIISISDVNGVIHVIIENEDGAQTAFLLDESTVFPFSDSFDVGDEVSGWYFYTADTPMISIYPPQRNAAVFAVGQPDNEFIKVDRFFPREGRENFMISQDGELEFTFDDNTVILTQDGQKYIDFNTEVSRRIVVIYDITMRSIPPQTTANKLIVLFEGIMGLA